VTEVRTTCPYCGVGCGVIVENGSVRGDPDHPANFGRLCSKGAALAETLDDTGRLTAPRIDGRAARWDEALDLVAARFSATIAEFGPDSVAFYGSGQFLTEDYYVANKLMKGFIGSANIDTNSRLCMASTVAGHQRAFGEDVVPGIYEDWDETDLAVLVGSNTAWCHPILYQRLKAARAARGTFVVVIDPRRTATCEIADLHLAVAPGADVALFDGLLVYLTENHHLDRAWIDAHCNGFEAALAVARESAGTVAQVAAATGLPAADIMVFYERFAATERAMTVFSQGVNQSTAGTDKVNAIINCHLATGRIGRPGMGPFSVTGQPNAMGGREVGGLANQLAAHLRFDEPADIDRVRRFWRAKRLATAPGLKAVDLFDAVEAGRIKAIWIMATNPAASMPRAASVRRALEACPFVVVSDCWNTDTTALADVVLPAATWSEKDGTVTNSEHRISRQRGFRAPPGEAKPDWWILSNVARRMGWEDSFAYRTPAEIFREHAALSTFENDDTRAFDLSAFTGLSDSAYEELKPQRWPAAKHVSEGGRLFGDGIFRTPDRRARFIPTPWKPPAARTSRRFPFMLNTGRVRDQWHTMTRTGRVPRLMLHQDEAVVDVAASDARKLCVGSGDLIQIRTEHGAAVLPAQISDAQRQGEVFVAMHWTDRFVSAGPIDQLVSAAFDPVSGQPELKATAAALAPMPILWRGLLVGGEGPRASGDYHWSRIPTAHGDLWILRGWSRLAEGAKLSDWATQLLGEPEGAEPMSLYEPTRGVLRIANIVKGRLHSCLLLSLDARSPLPERDAIESMIGEAFDEAAKQQFFAIEDAPACPSHARAICVCHSVSRDTIEREIKARRLTSVAAIGAALKAGTNCGSCIPELQEILDVTSEAKVSAAV
jgi:assimilatory nitrate reductase catalytic subunit